MHSTPTTLPVPGDDPRGVAEVVELDLLLLGVMDLHRVGGHLLDGAPVDEVHILLADPEGGADAVDRHVAAPDHDDLLPFGVGILPLADVQEIPDAGDEPAVPLLLALHPHGHAVLGADADEDGIVIPPEIRDGDRPFPPRRRSGSPRRPPGRCPPRARGSAGGGGNRGSRRRPCRPARGVSRRSSAGSPSGPGSRRRRGRPDRRR